MALQRHEVGAFIVLTIAAAGVGALGLIAMLAALLDALNAMSLGVGVSIPLAALATRKGNRR